MMREKLFKTRLEKFVLMIWLVIPVIVLCIILYGWKMGDKKEDILLGIQISFLLVSLLTVISVILSFYCSRAIFVYSQIIWIMISFIALSSAAINSLTYLEAYTGASMILVYTMIILTFPISGFVPIIFYMSSLFFPDFTNSADYNILFLVFMWFSFFVAGYVQWFIFLPWVFRKWKAKK